MSDNSGILLFYAGLGLSLASVAGFYNSKRNSELSHAIKNAPVASLDDPSSFLGKDCVILKGYASVPYGNEPMAFNGLKDLIYYRRLVQARSIQVPWTPMGSASFIPGLLLGTSSAATGSIEKPIAREDKKAPDWGLRSHKIQNPDTPFLRLPTNTVLNDSDLKIIKETEEPAGSPFVSALLSTVRYSYPYAHNVQEKVMTEGTPLMAIGKIEPWHSPLSQSNLQENLVSNKYVLSTPKYVNNFSLFPTPNIVTTIPLSEIQSDLDNSAQKSKMFSTGLMTLSLACFAYGLKLHSGDSKSNEK